MSWIKLLDVTSGLSLLHRKKVTLYEDGVYKELTKGWPLY